MLKRVLLLAVCLLQMLMLITSVSMADRVLAVTDFPEAFAPYLKAAGYDQIDVGSTIPPDLSAYDLVVVERYGACNPTTAEYLRAYVQSGGGVYLFSGTIYYLGMPPWIGAGGYVNTSGPDTYIMATTKFGVPAGTILFEGGPGAGAAVAAIGPRSTVIHRDDDGLITGYIHREGLGRVVFDTSSFDERFGRPVAGALTVSLLKWARQ